MVDWSMGISDPLRSQQQGLDYANKIFDMQAQKRAGTAVAAGDYQGAATALGSRGDVEGAHKLRNFPDTQKAAQASEQLKKLEARQQYLKQSFPILSHIYKTAGPAALAQAFDQIAPELQQLGVSEQQIAAYRQGFQTNPEALLQALGAGAAKEYEFRQVGDDIAVIDKATGQEDPAKRIKGTPKTGADSVPSGYMRAPGNPNALKFVPGGPADPDIKKRDAENSRQVIVNNPLPQAESPQAQQRNSVQLRKEFDALPEVKQFNEVANAVEIVQQLAASKTAADDVGLIFSFMKTLDPNSVVRETEFATAQNAAGIPDQIRNMYNRALSGNRLNDTQRGQFVQTVRSVYDARRKRYDQIIRQYQGYARDYGLPEGTVSPRDPMSAAPPQPAGGRIPYANAQPSPQGGNVIRYDAQGNRVQ